MQRKRDGLIPVAEALADLPGPVQALREEPPPALHHFTLSDQVDALVGASEADPDLGFMARMLALCSLPRTNPGQRYRYVRRNGPYTLVMSATGINKLPYGNLPRLILAWVSTEAVRTRASLGVGGRHLTKDVRQKIASELAKDCRGRTEVLGRFRAELEGRHRWERVSLGKAHSEAVRGIERKEGEAYRSGMEGSEERAWEAARTNGRSVYYNPPIDRYARLSAWEERMELVRELDGEQAYEKMCRAVERASQPLSPSQVSSRGGPERPGPKRDFDFGPSR